jgi:hypothetical protein
MHQNKRYRLGFLSAFFDRLRLMTSVCLKVTRGHRILKMGQSITINAKLSKIPSALVSYI